MIVCILIFVHFQYTVKQHNISVSNGGFEWSPDFGPSSVTLTVKDFIQEETLSSQEISLTAWRLLLSQRQDFSNNPLARVLFKPKHEGSMEMKDEVLSSVGAQDMDTSG